MWNLEHSTVVLAISLVSIMKYKVEELSNLGLKVFGNLANPTI